MESCSIRLFVTGSFAVSGLGRNFLLQLELEEGTLATAWTAWEAVSEAVRPAQVGRCPGRGGARAGGGSRNAAGQSDKGGSHQVGPGGDPSPAPGVVLKVRESPELKR